MQLSRYFGFLKMSFSTKHSKVLCTSLCRIFALMLKLFNEWLLLLLLSSSLLKVDNHCHRYSSLSTDFCHGTFRHCWLFCLSLPILDVVHPSPPRSTTLSLSFVLNSYFYTLCPEKSPLPCLSIITSNLNRLYKYFTHKISSILLTLYCIFVEINFRFLSLPS